MSAAGPLGHLAASILSMSDIPDFDLRKRTNIVRGGPVTLIRCQKLNRIHSTSYPESVVVVVAEVVVVVGIVVVVVVVVVVDVVVVATVAS